MRIQDKTIEGEWFRLEHIRFSGYEQVKRLSDDAKSKLQLSDVEKPEAWPYNHVIPLAIVKELDLSGKKGLYLGCNVPLGVLMLQLEGYQMSAASTNRKGMELGKRHGLDCICIEPDKITKHFGEESFDFIISMDFKMRYLHGDKGVVAITEEEFKALKHGGYSLSYSLGWEAYLKEKPEKLFRKTSFGENITRYKVQVPPISMPGMPYVVVDVLRKPVK